MTCPWKNGFLSNPGRLWIQFGAMTSTRSLPRRGHRAQFPGDYVGDYGDCGGDDLYLYRESYCGARRLFVVIVRLSLFSQSHASSLSTSILPFDSLLNQVLFFTPCRISASLHAASLSGWPPYCLPISLCLSLASVPPPLPALCLNPRPTPYRRRTAAAYPLWRSIPRLIE